MESVFKHEVVFETKSDLFVSDVARSLLANEEILKLIGPVLENCIDGLIVEKVYIKFKSCTTNSPLKETIWAAIFTQAQPELNKKVPKMIEHLSGMHVPDEYNGLVTILTIAIVIYGIDFAYKKINAKGGESAAEGSMTITGNQNVVLKIAGDVLGESPEKIASAIESAVKPAQRNSIAKRALDFIRPAKRDGAAISGGGALITAETIAAAPSDIDIEAADDESHDPFQRQSVVIHATDIDKTKTGWAGHLPNIYEKRLRMQLYPGIDPKRLFGKSEIIADIIVASKPNKDGELVPYLFHVVKVYD